MTRYAPARDDGLFPYVREWSDRLGLCSDIVWSNSLRAAQQEAGWPKSRFPLDGEVPAVLRRASPADITPAPSASEPKDTP